MKEDMVEKMIRSFFVVFQKMAGYVTNDDFEGAKIVLQENYSGKLIEDFLSDKIDLNNRLRYQELLFQLDLHYYNLLLQVKTNLLDGDQKRLYLKACQKLQSNATGVYDYSLQLKINEIESL